RSPSDSLSTLQEKMREYCDNGTQLGWLIDRQNRQVEIYRPGQDRETLDNPTTLSGENVLPGFNLELERIW
ncbi:MAG: Uma2 family endonuclease, partial [Spirulinaceae cyanobacterium]